MNRIVNRTIKLFLCLNAIVSLFMINSMMTAYAANSSGTFKDIDRSHWAYEAIYQSVEDGLVEGYEDHTFRPGQNVSATEFIIMFYRAYHDELNLSQVKTDWKQPYVQLANEKTWNIDALKSTLNRGEVAQFIYSVFEGKQAQATEAITYMLYQKYSNGLTSATVAGYGEKILLNRAQAVTFIQNIKQKVPTLNSYIPLEEGQLSSIKSEEPILYADIHLREVQLGESVTSLLAKLGTPNRQFTIGDISYYSYNSEYNAYALYIVANNTVQGMYSNAQSVWQSSKVKLVGEVAPTQLKATIDKAQIVYYQDKHDKNKIEAILAVTSNQYIPSYAATKQEGIEIAMQNFDITNAFRVKQGLQALKWYEDLANTAYKYSVYMYTNDHFDHYDLEGLSPFDRMANDGISYYSAGENIAAGYSNAMDVANGWFNSLGHRQNILSDWFTYIGIGVHERYYTQNFIGK